MYCRTVPNKTTVLVEAALGKARDKDTSVTAWDVSTYNADTHLLISVFSVRSGVCAAHTVMQQGSRYASMLVRSVQALVFPSLGTQHPQKGAAQEASPGWSLLALFLL